MATVSIVKATYSDPEIETILYDAGYSYHREATAIYHGRYFGNARPGGPGSGDPVKMDPIGIFKNYEITPFPYLSSSQTLNY
jgi:hypothetical protein